MFFRIGIGNFMTVLVSCSTAGDEAALLDTSASALNGYRGFDWQQLRTKSRIRVVCWSLLSRELNLT